MKAFLTLVTILTILSCKNKGGTDSAVTSNEGKKADTATFFQTADFVKGQLAEVNKTPYFIYKLVEADGKKDSTASNNEELAQLAKPFLTADINNPATKQFYKEVIFHDQTTKSFTLNYSTTNKELEIQNIDVLLEEDGETVKRIFIRKFFKYNDSSAIEQLSWKPNTSFQIARLVESAYGKEKNYKTTVVWNEQVK